MHLVYTRGCREQSRDQTPKESSDGVTNAEIGNLFDNLRTNILSTLSSQLDTLQAKHKQMELEKTMAIFYPQCRKKHPLKEFPLNTVETFAICEQIHSTRSCSSLPGKKAIFQGTNEEIDNM